MLASRRSIIGLKILLLVHATQSFVLLTANIEDVKKLAMKFVSESFADKIATFVGRAAQRVINQVSDEIHKDSRDVSEENEQYKHAMSSDEVDKLEETKVTKSSREALPEKGIFNPGEVASKYGPVKKQPVQYAYPVNPENEHRKHTTKKKLNNENELEKDELKKKRKHRQKSKNVKRDYGSNYKFDEKSVNKEKHNKYKSHHLNLANAKSNEVNRIEENNRDIDSQYRVTFRANDFDKDEIVNNLPIMVLATSGSVMLTKLSTEKSVDGRKTYVE